MKSGNKIKIKSYFHVGILSNDKDSTLSIPYKFVVENYIKTI